MPDDDVTRPSEPAPTAEFAPADYTDGRVLLDWESKYPRAARIQIWFEAIYLAVLLIALPWTILSLWIGAPNRIFLLDKPTYTNICKYLFALTGGAFGGTLFSTKWLYHSVAKQRWHLDRRLWRLFTPLLSAGVSFATTLLINANVVSVFNQQALESPQSVLGISFLVGYFSDTAIAKLSEVAETVFGATHESNRRPVRR